ncbi:Melibiose carrier protein, Na+/melibiose symporter [Staphylococcus pseudintermedius]|nr:Melibiose carrier protein, Na+/melibiose symporter [Staphylococcus pseudintermedius]
MKDMKQKEGAVSSSQNMTAIKVDAKPFGMKDKIGYIE